LVPTINGKMHHFNNVGLYDGLFVMQDTETKTLWNHITGEAMYGSLVGRTLGPLTNLLQMTVKQALEMDSKVHVAISDRMYFAGGKQFGTAAGFGRGRGPAGSGGPGGPGRPGGPGLARAGGPGRGFGSRPAPGDPNARLSDMFIQTLGKEDTRRPRMDMGLGIWTDTLRRYYPMERIRERGEAFVDQVGGRNVLVYVEPVSNTPAAIYVDGAVKSAKREDQEVRLDNGASVRSGVLRDRQGREHPVERPQQIFTRWYGFALTFPGPEVYGQ
jgi:hypothetical protein